MRKTTKKQKRNAFTLVELLAVIVIMGLILLIVFPTMSKMINNNDQQEFDSYYDLVEEAALTYANKLKDELGSGNDVGCHMVTLEELIEEEYVQKFSDSKITCRTGINSIKIRNNKGKISANFNLKCTEDDEEIYNFGSDDHDECKPYEISEDTNIKTKLELDDGITKTETTDNNIYITGENPNNYIWYSGKLWRIVSYNELTEIVKAVTVNPITSIYYNHLDESNFLGSDVETWINNEFLVSLKDSQNFLINSNWNSTPNTNMDIDPTSNAKLKKSKVGLINTFEYGKIKQWYSTSNKTWLLSEGTDGNSLYSDTNIQTSKSTTIYGIRPAVTFSSSVLIYSGTGTEEDPYIIDSSENSTGKKGDLINTRYSGEYIKFANNIYRIVSVDNKYTKVIGMTSRIKNMYSDNHFDYASSSLKDDLLSKYNESYKSYMVKGDYCLDTINNSNLVYHSPACLTHSRINNSILIGLPKIGDLFTTSIEGVDEYWTLNPNTEIVDGNHYNSTINTIKPDGSVSTAVISEKKETIDVFYLDSSVRIKSGSGTKLDPYVIEK